METTKPKLWTENGLKELGRLIKRSRTAKGLSLRALEEYIEVRTGHLIANTTLSGLERANREPNWNTLAIVAAAEFILKEDESPYSVEELSAIASETFFSVSTSLNTSVSAVKSLRRVQSQALKDDGFLPPLTTKGARRLKNLVLAEGQRRGWGEAEFIEAGCDPELYQVIVAEDWFQRYPAPELLLSLATLLSRVRFWESDIPVLGEGCYGQAQELWDALELGNGAVATRCDA